MTLQRPGNEMYFPAKRTTNREGSALFPPGAALYQENHVNKYNAQHQSLVSPPWLGRMFTVVILRRQVRGIHAEEFRRRFLFFEQIHALPRQ